MSLFAGKRREKNKSRGEAVQLAPTIFFHAVGERKESGEMFADAQQGGSFQKKRLEELESD